jgi:hypothetical protein
VRISEEAADEKNLKIFFLNWPLRFKEVSE